MGRPWGTGPATCARRLLSYYYDLLLGLIQLTVYRDSGVVYQLLSRNSLVQRPNTEWKKVPFYLLHSICMVQYFLCLGTVNPPKINTGHSKPAENQSQTCYVLVRDRPSVGTNYLFVFRVQLTCQFRFVLLKAVFQCHLLLIQIMLIILTSWP